MTGPVEGGEGRRDLFVSYAGPDRPWAEWVAAQADDAGYAVELDVWEWAAGDNVVLRMNQALTRAYRVLMLWSPTYFEPVRFTTPEWTAVFMEAVLEPRRRHMIPVRIAEVTPPLLLAQLHYRDLFGRDEEGARRELLAALTDPTGRGDRRPAFPGVPRPTTAASSTSSRPGPKLPGTLPQVWNVPRRTQAFTGRQKVLAHLRQALTSGRRGRVQVLNGIGGVGKTQLAIEYAHMFAGDYDLVWWVNAAHPEFVSDQLAALAVRAGWPTLPGVFPDVVQQVTDQLRKETRWLLIFDDVADPDHAYVWLPSGHGHVILISRGHGQVAAPVQVQVFSRKESISLLRIHLPTLPDEAADAVAHALGDLPLAVAQAAGLLSRTQMPVADYLVELNAHASDVLDAPHPPGYSQSLAAAIRTALDRLTEQHPAGAQLLHLAAVLAPEPIRLEWLQETPANVLPADLAAVVTRRLTWRQTLAHVRDSGLAQLTEETLQVHRLTQAIIRDRRSSQELADDRARAARVISAAAEHHPGQDSASNATWDALLPHLVMLDSGAATNPECGCEACDLLPRDSE